MNKDLIIMEIKRLAKAKNDVPPGMDRFESETGIPKTAWRGKYWENWSDALKEAGLEANKKTAALPHEDLFEALAQLTKEKRQIPTQIQIVMRARKEPGFPWPSTFQKLGSRTERVAKLLEYCRNQPGFGDVVAICENALARLPTDGEVSAGSSEGDGVVYLLKSGRRHKFGFTNDLERRIRELAHQTSEPISKVHSIRTDDASGIEA
jgi:hypothetical protein